MKLLFQTTERTVALFLSVNFVSPLLKRPKDSGTHDDWLDIAALAEDDIKRTPSIVNPY